MAVPSPATPGAPGAPSDPPAAPPRPGPDDAAASYQSYIAEVPGEDVIGALERGIADTLALFARFGEARGTHRYAPGKWSVKELAGHLCDAERVFGYRALRFARGDPTPLAGFEEDAYVARAGFDRRALLDLTDELASLRRANLALFRSLDAEAWTGTGTASDNRFVARAFPWIIAGHELHHCRVLRERYL